MHGSTLFIAVVLAAVVYAGFVSYLVVRAPTYSSSQKVVQVIVVWLLPVLGTAVVHWFAKHGAAEQPPIERHPYREHELPE
jgi:hypothetical protein